MKKQNLRWPYLSVLPLSLLMISACDNISGTSDVSTNSKTVSQTINPAFVIGVDEVGVAGIFIDEISDFELTSAELTTGYEVNISGYVGYLSSSTGGNNPRLTELILEVEKDGTGVWDEIDTWDSTPLLSNVLAGRGNQPGREFSDIAFSFDPWVISETGSYVVRATAVFTGTGTNEIDTEEVLVTLLTDFVVEFPAAPAIAARILEANDISPRYGKGKNGGNYISNVAKHMGPGTDFDGESKGNEDSTEMNQNYWDAVWDYLRAATGESLNVKPAGYIW